MNYILGGLGPCIAIGAIYDKRGYMVHEHALRPDYAYFLERTIFADLRRDVKDKKKLQIYVVGGEIDAQYTNEKREGRKIVLEKIVENGFQDSVIKIQWCPLEHNQSLRLILSEGRAEIEEDSMNE